MTILILLMIYAYVTHTYAIIPYIEYTAYLYLFALGILEVRKGEKVSGCSTLIILAFLVFLNVVI